MSEKIKSVRGMNDLLPPESAKWRFFEERCHALFSRYGYKEIRTPILESTALFSRGIGEATDIVEKEMYTFKDLSDRPMAMRPEGTAACVRAYIQHSMHKKEAVTRWFYSGPMFRYERMQTGRYRQFYQIGVEAYGVAEASIEAEQISMLYELYSSLEIPNIEVLINSVGCGDDRPRYRQALVDFATPFRDSMCEDCKRRIESNPLRLLDCKVTSCKTKMKEAPSVLDSLSEESLLHFENTKVALDAIGVPYTVDSGLVRGLDYYTGTVFEITANTTILGNQNTIVAGGRYDGLVEQLGGPSTPAVGFALGIERAVMSFGEEENYALTPKVYIASLGAKANKLKMSFAAKLRKAGHYIELEHRSASMKSQFKRADKLNAPFVVVIGEQEIESGVVKLKNMKERSEQSIANDQLIATLLELLH